MRPAQVLGSPASKEKAQISPVSCSLKAAAGGAAESHLNCCAASELDRRSVAQPRTVAQLARMPGGKSNAPAISLKG